MPRLASLFSGRCRRLVVAAAITAVATMVLSGCSGGSVLNPQGYAARQVAGLWWWLFWASVGVWVAVMLLVGWALVRRRRATVEVRGGDALGFVGTAGIIVPLVILIVVYAVSIRTQAAISTFPEGRASLRVEVTGHQWWWEVRYPDTGAITANEIHIPVGIPVRVNLTTGDVIHSFWVPQLAPKMDLISGKVNTLWLRADRAGRYPGQCAEYCGVEHTIMDFLVVAEPEDDYQTWLKNRRAPARAPTTDAQRRGLAGLRGQRLRVVPHHQRHRRQGQGRSGSVDHRFPMDHRRRCTAEHAENLGGWIANAQTSKPGNKMPPQPLDPGRPAGTAVLPGVPAVTHRRRRHRLEREMSVVDDHSAADRQSRALVCQPRPWTDLNVTGGSRRSARLPQHRGPQARWPPLPGDLWSVLRPGRSGALSMRTQLAGPERTLLSAARIQPAVHHARHGDDLPVRHPDALRIRQLPAATDDRRSGHGVSPG